MPHRVHQPPDQRPSLPGNVLLNGVVLGSLVTTNVENIPVAFCGDQSSLGAFVFKQRIRSDRRAMVDVLNVGWGDSVGLMSGHIPSQASSHEFALVRDLGYDTPRIVGDSAPALYRRRAAVDTWASTEGDHDFCGCHPRETDRHPSGVK